MLLQVDQKKKVQCTQIKISNNLPFKICNESIMKILYT